MVGLALEGGGAKGSYQIGAYFALKKCRIKIDAVAGTSIGAFNGAFIASHDEKKLLKMWTDLSISELLDIDEDRIDDILNNGFNLKNIKWTFTEMYNTFRNKGIDISGYRALIRNNLDEVKLRKSNIRYALNTVKMPEFEPLNLYLENIPKGKVCDYIVASSYLPIFKRENTTDNYYYLDGGFYNINPIDSLIEMGCTTIYSINIKGIGIRRSNRNKKINKIEIEPKNNLGKILTFNKKTNIQNIKYGYYDTLRTLGKIDGIDYYFKKKSNWYYKRLNHNIDKNFYKIVQAILNGKDYKDTVLKALEYALKKQKKSDLNIYKQKYIIREYRKKNHHNIIYKYLSLLKLL